MSLRERLAFSPERVREALGRITREGVLAEGVIVSTCNRSEIYGVSGAAGDSATDALTEFVAGFHALPRPEIAGVRYGLSGGDAARHLFRVAAGLESMVVGEDQILGPGERGSRVSRRAPARRARSFTGCSSGRSRRASAFVRKRGVSSRPTSIPGVAMELAEKVYEDIDRKSFLIVGAGETASIFYDLLWNRGARKIEVVNRTHSRAEQVVARGGTARRWDELHGRLPHADVVVCAVSSPEPVLSAGGRCARACHRGADLRCCSSISGFRGTSSRRPGASTTPSCTASTTCRKSRRETAPSARRTSRAAEKIVEEEVSDFLAWYGSLAVVPTVTALRAEFERIREESFDRELERLETLPPDQREKVRLLAQSMVRKLLSHPTSALKDEEDPALRISRAEAIRHLFRLDQKPPE